MTDSPYRGFAFLQIRNPISAIRNFFLPAYQRQDTFLERIRHLANGVRIDKLDESRNAGKFGCCDYQGFGWKKSRNLGLNYDERKPIQSGMRI